MGDSAEVRGVKCSTCARSCPPNNWKYFAWDCSCDLVAFYDDYYSRAKLIKYVRHVKREKGWAYYCLACLRTKFPSDYATLKMHACGVALLYVDGEAFEV